MSGHAGANKIKASQPATKQPVAQLQRPAPAPKPADQKTAPATDAPSKLEHVTEVAETESAALSDGRLDRVLAPDAVIAASAKKIAAAFQGVREALDRESPPPAAIAAMMQRLDVAIGTLYVLGRRHHVRMREAHLEQLFDMEDGVRAQHSLNGQAHRAESYYDDQAAATPSGDATPDAASLSKEVKDTKDSASDTRAVVLKKAQTLGDEMSGALGVALALAKTKITELDRPAEKSILERLADFAAKMLLQVAEVAFAELLGAGIGSASSAVGAEEHLGKDVAEIFVDGFKDGGKDVVNEALADTHGAVGNEGKPEGKSEASEETNSKLTPKSAYLDAATKRTLVAQTGIQRRFAAKSSLFPRIPTDTLRALVDGFKSDSIRDEYTSLVIREWVNFGKNAAAAGVEMRDPEKIKNMQGRPSRVDNLLDPYGVLRIGVRLDEGARPRLERARIGGISDTVLQHLRQSKDSLGSIGINRRVELVGEDSSISGEGFELDPFGVVVGKPARLTQAGRVTLARVAGHQLGESVSDGDVYAGMFALTSWLRTVPCTKIEAGGE